MDKYIDMVFEYQQQAAKPYGQAKHLKIHFSKRHTILEKQWVSSESAAQYNDSVTTSRSPGMARRKTHHSQHTAAMENLLLARDQT